ncbi:MULTISPECIES: hypothetical protein [Bacteria]
MSLVVLTGLSILAAGGLTAAISAAPSPATGLLFAASAVLSIVAGTLCVRVVLALERVRRGIRPRAVASPDDFPVLSKVFSGLARTREREEPR